MLAIKPAEAGVWLVTKDCTVLTGLTLGDLLESFDASPLKPLELVAHLLPSYVDLASAEVKCVFYDPSSQTAVIEYSVGGLDAKLVHGIDLGKSLELYDKLKPDACRRASS